MYCIVMGEEGWNKFETLHPSTKTERNTTRRRNV
jgi:hypothetical protein